MRDKDLYAQILGIKSPWQVAAVELSVSEGEVTVVTDQLMEPPMFALKAPRRSAISALQTG